MLGLLWAYFSTFLWVWAGSASNKKSKSGSASTWCGSTTLHVCTSGLCFLFPKVCWGLVSVILNSKLLQLTLQYLWYGSGSVDPYHWVTDPAHFWGVFQDANKKKVFFSQFLFVTFCRYIYITSVLKYKKMLRSNKTVEIKVFLKFYACSLFM
jgi:hypothetical protein